jgi:positive regulator of sigma E activity
MKNIAYVKEISGENGENAVLRIKRECMCSGKKECGTKCFSLASLGNDKDKNDIIETGIYNNIGAEAGDYVEVEGKTSAVLIYALIVFIMPVFTGLILYFISDFYIDSNSSIVPYIISGAGFILSILLLRFLNKTAKKRKRRDFIITKIL